MRDLVMLVEKISYGVELVKSCPETTFVIDHSSVCPVLADSDTRLHWKDAIAA